MPASPLQRRSQRPPIVRLGVYALIAGAGVLLGPVEADAQMHGHGMRAGMHGHGAGGHDEVNMPGLRGLNASEAESAELAVLFRRDMRKSW